MASTDARPIPQKNVAYRVTFPIFDADGDLVTGASGLDSEVSKDGGTFADCTNEATEIATSSGMYYLDLTSTEMNADTVAVIVKTTSSGAKTTPIVMYPEEVGDVRVNVTAYGGTAGTFSAGRPEVNTTHVAGTSQTARDIGASVLLSSGTGTGQISLSSGAVTAGTVSDKTGYSLSAGGVQAIWDALTSALTTASSIGKLLVDNINATISSRLASASYTAPLDAAGTRSAIGMASANLDTQLATIAGYIDTEVSAIKAKTDLIPASPAAVGSPMTLAADSVTAAALAADAVAEIQSGLSTLTAAGVRSAIGLASANLDTQLDALPTAAENADAVWDEVLSGHLTAGSTGNALNAAGSAGDPWSTALPGAYGAGTAGKIVGDNLNATVSSRLATAGYTAPDNASITAIKAKTDNLPTDPADASDIASSFSTVNTTLSTISGYIDTEIAAIKAKTDNLPASPAATSDIPTAAVVADAVWDEARSGHTTAGSFGEGVLLAEVRVKKNTALSNFMFLMVDETDFATPETGLTVTATRSIDGAAFAACANSATEVGSGVYKINLAAADLNGNVVTLKFTATGAAQRTITVVTQP